MGHSSLGLACALLGASLCCAGASAAERAATALSLTSDRVQRPANFVRSRQSVTLLARMDLQTGDLVQTGARGKLEVGFDEAMALQLPESSQLQLHSVQAAGVGQPAQLRARLDKGSLRVINPSSPDAQARDLRLNVGQLRLRAGQAEFIASAVGTGTVCVLSGAVDVYPIDRDQGSTLKQGCLAIDASGGLAPVDDGGLIARVVAAASFAPVDLNVPPSGWTVVVASLADRSSADAETRGLQGEGLPARTVAFQDTWRVAIGGFAEQSQAQSYAEKLRRSHGLFEAWVTAY